MIAAAIAFAVMHANNVATVGASIFLRLDFEKLIHAFFPEDFLVFHHTHAIALSIPLIKAGKVSAGHGVTLVAVLDLVFG